MMMGTPRTTTTILWIILILTLSWPPTPSFAFQFNHPRPVIEYRSKHSREDVDKTSVTERWQKIIRKPPPSLSAIASNGNKVEWQSDKKQFGRGQRHLSVLLEEGDVVMYRSGNWHIDGVLVGDDTKPSRWEWCVIDTIQVVWTNNCEHGAIRGRALGVEPVWQGEETNHHQENIKFVAREECIEFGPEQLVARVPVRWDNAAQVAAPLEALSLNSIRKKFDDMELML